MIPARNTPFSSARPGDVSTTLRAIALMRILRPDVLIPAVSALEMLRAGGQGAGLDAGANVITANVTADQYRAAYGIYGDQRYIVQVAKAHTLLEARQLEIGSPKYSDERQIDKSGERITAWRQYR